MEAEMSATESKHTPGAIRAGRNIIERFRRVLPGLAASNALTLAIIIDRETAAPAMLEALEAATAFLNAIKGLTIGGEGAHARDARLQCEAAIKLAKGESQ
jgi:hypothetical protein